jgi:hypothetical protein
MTHSNDQLNALNSEPLAEQVLREISSFLSRHAMTKTQFGKAAVNDPGFVFGLESGRNTGVKTVDRARKYMAGRDAKIGEGVPLVTASATVTS